MWCQNPSEIGEVGSRTARAVLRGGLELAAVAALLVCTSCSQRQASKEPSPTKSDAYSLGVAAAEGELRQNDASIWVTGLVPPQGHDPDTGLPYRAVAYDLVPRDLESAIKGHNDTIRSSVGRLRGGDQRRGPTTAP